MTQQPIYQPPIYQLTTPISYQVQPQPIYQPQPQVIYQPQQIQILPQNLSQNRTQRLKLTQQSWKSSIVVHQLIPSFSNQSTRPCSQNSETRHAQNPNSQHYLSLLVTPENAQPNNLETNQQPTLISNIPLATITKNKSLDAIFSFELKELLVTPLFSGAALKKKPITAMYTDAKVDGHLIKLILDSRSAGSIITRQLMDQLGH
ncbi:hypothetical protein G9A89_014275 [Geosiphon pyriformis]|nr:hypothetical protein G9A89_014275 [Geosiphon pyriformis]